MTTFTNFADILPNPTYTIGPAGEANGSLEGPGYSSVTLSSNEKIMKTRTNSGRYISRASSNQYWKMNISYNPMTRTEFNPVQTFMFSRRGGLVPFFVSLPQYEVPQNATFSANATYVNSLFLPNAAYAGETSMKLEGVSYAFATHGTPTAGDVFTITDASNTNHKKVYMITGVETADLLQNTTTLDADQIKIHFTPGLQKDVTAASTTQFKDVLFKVVSGKDTQEYSLGTNNLYQFSLSLEEVQ